ncbi:hypothetical protein [Allisonella histaminiformans]|nr:hypothetical protein [Allisonella histaminiformans]
MLLLNFYQRGHTQYPPPVLPKEYTDLPFDVKALRNDKGLSFLPVNH